MVFETINARPQHIMRVWEVEKTNDRECRELAQNYENSLYEVSFTQYCSLINLVWILKIKRKTNESPFIFSQTIYNELLPTSVKFSDAPGPTSVKFTLFKSLCWNFQHSAFTHLKQELLKLKPCHSLYQENSKMLQKYQSIGEFYCSVNRRQFKTFTNVEIMERLNSKVSEVDECFENSRDKDSSFSEEIDFCSFNIPKALKCTQKLFANSLDLVGFKAYTHFWVKQFNCENRKVSEATEDFYAMLFKVKNDESRSFYRNFVGFTGELQKL